MRRTSGLLLLALLLLAGTVRAGEGGLQRIPDAQLQPSQQQCAKLPCGQDGRLALADLPGRYLLIEIFSMYCPYCQASADEVNRLARLIQRSPNADQMFLLGLGAGNSRFEVDYFRDKFDVPFPLFPDRDMAVYDHLDDPGTPFFILAEKDDKPGLRVLWTHAGPFDNPRDFLDTVLDKAGLKP